MKLFKPQPPDIAAALDLGSNSFHMIVARIEDGQILVLDRLREMVRLAAGFDQDRRLTPAAEQRALECLERFGQRLRDLPDTSVRVVGTNTLRSARNADTFVVAARAALGHPIEIISGVEEARLIYLGVAHTLADDGRRRLVMDIGGGSTEIIVGEQFEPLQLESLHIGCVDMSGRFFSGGSITKKRFNRAVLAARVEFEPVDAHFRQLGWEDAVGASGTIRAVRDVIHAAGWDTNGITPTGLKRLEETLIKAGDVSKLSLPGLDPARAPVFPGGVAVLSAAFDALGIERMRVSSGALREGLLYDLLGRIHHEDDVRARSVFALAGRYHVDPAQAKRVETTALFLFEQVADAWKLGDERYAQLLTWAARLHEIGLDISHSKYHKHGAYVIENADLLGFSRQEQRAVATLVRCHRRKLSISTLTDLLPGNGTALLHLVAILRVAVVLHRSRSTDPPPDIAVDAAPARLSLTFPSQWLDRHPLTNADLEHEAGYLGAAGLTFTVQ